MEFCDARIDVLLLLYDIKVDLFPIAKPWLLKKIVTVNLNFPEILILLYLHILLNTPTDTPTIWP